MQRRKFFGLKFVFMCFCREYSLAEKVRFLSRNTNLWIVTIVFVNMAYFYCNYKCGYLETDRPLNLSFPFVKHYKFHRRLISYKRFMAMNNRYTNLGKAENPTYNETTKFCYIKKHFLGPRTVNKTELNLTWVEDGLPQVLSGGFHAPKNCRSRHRVAIFVPYRDRYVNLVIFLHYMHPLFQKQKLQYRVFVIEQFGEYKFNKGALYNIAFIESQRFGKWDCMVFHDVDLIPLDERILYTCPRNPMHMSPAVDYTNFKLQYNTLFGGVTAMTPKDFLLVNGYSNYYWNWGAEDDDMYNRLKAARLSMSRLNSSIARFATLPHKPQSKNPHRSFNLKKAKVTLLPDDLRTFEYNLISITKYKLFTHILVDFNAAQHKFYY